MNDKVDHHRPAEETLATLRRIIRRLRKKGVAVVLVYTPLGDFDREVYRQGLRDLTRRERVRLVEHFYDSIVPGLTVDGIHPSAEGHALLAQRLEPILRELLGGGVGRGDSRATQRTLERSEALANERRPVGRRGRRRSPVSEAERAQAPRPDPRDRLPSPRSLREIPPPSQRN